MRLSYRGVSYTSQSTLDMPVSDVSGKYRGVSIHFRAAAELPLPDEAPQLRYRGASYYKLH